MITCSVCGQENTDLSVICSSCKGFLQGRTEAIDLFATMWGLIESPRPTVRRIVLARHKNYALLLSAAAGIHLVFDIAWYKSLAPFFSGLLALAGTAIIIGPVLGIVVIFFETIALQIMTKSFGGIATRRNLFAALAYATSPVAWSLFLVVPLQLAIFGLDFFGTNPSPMVIKPVEYTLLLCLKGVVLLYALYLSIEATVAANGFGRNRFVPVTISILSVVLLGVVVLHFVNV